MNNGIPPAVVAAIQIQMTDDGQIAVKCSGEMLAIFAALGNAQAQLAMRFQQQIAQTQIQVPPAEVANRLLNL